MPARHRSRLRAVQVLYQWDIRKAPVEEAIGSFYRSLYSAEGGAEDDTPPPEPDAFMELLATGTARKAEEIDRLIAAHSQNWRLDRMAVVDRNILRMAVYEMQEVGTPAPVVIDEAIELAHRLSGEEAAKFVNGILDAVRKQLNQ
jgi:N utilization substance protein B